MCVVLLNICKYYYYDNLHNMQRDMFKAYVFAYCLINYLN